MSCVLAMFYRPGSAPITQSFFDELESLLAVLSTISTPCAITSDLNLCLDRPEDLSCQQLVALLEAFGMQQYVNQPTHDRSGVLDVVIMCTDLQPIKSTPRYWTSASPTIDLYGGSSIQ